MKLNKQRGRKYYVKKQTSMQWLFELVYSKYERDQVLMPRLNPEQRRRLLALREKAND
jgi:hypothetical protein